MSPRSGAALLPLAVSWVCIGAAGVSAGDGSRVAPRQHFTAEVNGASGESHPAVIRMACFGPIRPGETGHPMGGQTVAVERVPPSTPGSGYTGDRANSIGAFFGAPPPGAANSSYVRFAEYGTKAIPTSLELPCSGSGKVSFVPLPSQPPARDVEVPVDFVGQP